MTTLATSSLRVFTSTLLTHHVGRSNPRRLYFSEQPSQKVQACIPRGTERGQDESDNAICAPTLSLHAETQMYDTFDNTYQATIGMLALLDLPNDRHRLSLQNNVHGGSYGPAAIVGYRRVSQPFRHS